MKGRILISILLLLSLVSLHGQIEFTVGSPLFPPVNQWHEVTVDPMQIEIMHSIEQVKDQPYQFAIPVQVTFTPENSGFIVTGPDESVWVLPLSSKGALSLNLILGPYSLPEGAYIYLYDQNRKLVRGAFTRESGTNKLSMPVLPVPGDRMVLECHFPGRNIPRGSIGVTQVAHDFAGFFGLDGIKDRYYGRSESCEVDLNCSTNPDYLKAARSVVRLLVTGTDLCSGVLVNNTGRDYKAYVLTANHCIKTPDQAANTIFVFNYQSPWCDGPDMSDMHSMTGSILRAENKDIDFGLVELNTFPSIVFRPYFSGWDITPSIPSNTYTLHHPEGDAMKLSIDNNAPLSTSYPVGGFVSNSFWRVLRWDMGATEPGSSGGPLFDQNNRLRGTLTGGSGTCADPTKDYYAKLTRMFNITTVASTNLEPWLDPVSSGATVVNGRDPYEYNLSRSDTLGNFPDSDPGMISSYTALGWGLSTGNNSDSLINYAEHISFAGTGEIAWVRLNIAASDFINDADTIRVFIWRGGSQPGSVIASKKVKLKELRSNTVMDIDFGRTISVTGSYYVGYRVYYGSKYPLPQAQFAVKHSAPGPLTSQNRAWFHDGSAWKPFTLHPGYPMATSLGIKAVMVENSVLNDVEVPRSESPELIVFPNPFTRSISFSISDKGVSETSLKIYDNTGRVVSVSEYRNIFPGVLTLELPGLAPGIYYYGLTNDTRFHSGVLIKTEERR